MYLYGGFFFLFGSGFSHLVELPFEVVRFQRFCYLDNVTIANIARLMPNLMYLDISGDHAYDHRGIGHLKTLPNLKYLLLNQHSGAVFNPECLRQLRSYFSPLRYLALDPPVISTHLVPLLLNNIESRIRQELCDLLDMRSTSVDILWSSDPVGFGFVALCQLASVCIPRSIVKP